MFKISIIKLIAILIQKHFEMNELIKSIIKQIEDELIFSLTGLVLNQQCGTHTTNERLYQIGYANQLVLRYHNFDMTCNF